VKMSRTMMATVAVLVLSGVAAILEARGRAAVRSTSPGIVVPAPAAEGATPVPAPATPAREGRAARTGLWVG